MTPSFHKPAIQTASAALAAAFLGLCGPLAPSGSAEEQRIVNIDLVGAGAEGWPVAENQAPPSSFFLAGARHGFEHTGSVSGFSMAGAFSQVYPGMTMAVYTDEHHVEYAFLLSVGADPSRIRLRLNDVRFDTVTADGQIVYAGDGFEAYQHAPAVFRIDSEGRRHPVEGRALLVGGTETSVTMSERAEQGNELLNGTHFNVVPGDSGREGPDYDFFMSRYEVTNEQWIRFLNNAQMNPGNPRGEYMFFDEKGNVWINSAMQPERDELFRIDSARIRYDPDRAAGDRYSHVMDDRGRYPYASHPSAGVTWYGAVKYCNWLTLQSGRGPNEVCYREGTNTWDWAPVTSTNWTNGFFTAGERKAWLERKGFRLPMFRLYDQENNAYTNTFNEFLKAGSWNGSTNVQYGYGRDTYSTNDANAVDASMLLNTETLPVGYFNGQNPLVNGRALFNENAFGIHDLTGNVAEWLNDPARAGTPDARSLAGGSFRDRIRPLAEDVIVPPYAGDEGGGFRPTTTFMPESWTQVNILFCFHSTTKLSPEATERFGLTKETGPADAKTAFIAPAEPPLSFLSEPDVPPDTEEPAPPDLTADIEIPGILLQEPSPPEPLPPPEPPPPIEPFPPFIPGPPSPPEPPVEPSLFILDVYSQNPDARVPVTVTPDYYLRGSGETYFARQYEPGAIVTLSAPATAGGNVFQYWLRNGEPFRTTPTITVQMLSDLQLTAVYLTPAPPIQRTLVVDSTPGLGVPIAISRTDNNGLRNGNTILSRRYDNNAQVTVTAPATFNGETFLGWLRNGVPFSTAPAITVTMLSDITLTARYGQAISIDERNLTVASQNPDSGVAMAVSVEDLSRLQDGDTFFNRRYEFGQTVTVTAPPVAPNGNTFARWLRNGVPFSTNESITVEMLTDVVLTAIYEDPPPAVSLTVRSANPAGGVAIEIGTPDNDNQTDGTTTFTRTYNVGAVTTVTAPPIAPNGNEFQRWILNGTPLSTNTSVTLTMLADADLVAVYLPPPPPPRVWDLTVLSQNPDSGVPIAVSAPDINTGETGGYTAFGRAYTNGTQVVLTAPATAPGGNVFAYWLVDGERYTDLRTVSLMMTASRTVTAVYVEPEPVVRHLLTVESRNPNSAVVVTVAPADVNGQQNGSTTFTRLYDDGVTVTLTARDPAFPGSTIQFRQWLLDGTPISTNATINVTMWRDTTVTAVYGPSPAENDCTLTVESQTPDGGVPILISAPDIGTGETDGSTSFDRLYSYGTPVTVTAPPVAPNGNLFQHWLLNGVLYSRDAAITLTMLGNVTLTAVYALPPIERTLTVSSRNPDSGVNIQVGTQDNRGAQNGSTTFQRIYDDGETVTLTAPPVSPNGRDVFLRWERDGVPVTTNNVVDATLFRDIEMTAVYGPPNTFNLTVRSENPDRNVPIGISIPDVLGRTDGSTLFVRTYNPGETVIATAPAVSPSGTVFQYWLRNGVQFSSDLSVEISMLSDVELTAVYGPPEPVNRSLVVRSVNPDSGVPITIAPGDTRNLSNGETSLQRIYRDGETVAVTAPETVGTNTFREWIFNGSPYSTNLSVTVTMYQDHELIAVYGPPVQPQERVLTVDSRNPFSGVPITVSQPDISGNTDGSTVFVRIYNYGDTTTLTAPAISGTNNTEFLYWERDGVRYSDDLTVTIEMYSDARMTAVYGEAPRNVTLTVESRNPDSGVVISVAPGDINSETSGSTTFQRIYEPGQVVTLTAPTTAEDRPFLYWLYNGVAVSTNPVYSVTMLDDLTMTAVYGDPAPVEDVTLTVRSLGPDGPISTLIGATEDNNANAGGTTVFQRIYDSGTTVTLTAPSVSNGLNFHHWEIGGAVFSNNQTVSLTLLQNTTITAIYVQPAPSVSGL